MNKSGIYSIKKETASTPTYCRGCLSVDRNLSPLGDYMELFYYLLRGQNDSYEDLKYYDISLCWECKARLRSIQNFKHSIQNTHRLLQQSVHNLLNVNQVNLSTLISTHKNYYDVTIQHDETDCNSETQNKEESLDGNTSITENVEQLSDIKEEIDNDDTHWTFDDINQDTTKLEDNDYTEIHDIKLSALIEMGKTPKRKNTIRENKTTDLKCVKKTDIKKLYSKMAVKTQCKIDINKLDEYFTEVESSPSVIDDYKKERVNYLKKPFKCELCIISFKKLKHYNFHMKAHKESGAECQSQRQFYKCKLCHRHFTYTQRKKHLEVRHYIFSCKDCPYNCRSVRDFILHYRELHTRMICDYCGRMFKKKKSIETHIRRHHSPRECRTCNRTFKTYHALDKHFRECHPENCEKELAYCVECDKQYSSVYKYKRHLTTGVKHKAPKKLRIPCPDCGKVFVRTTYMNNHYKLIHMKKSKHYCSLCDKYFFNSYSLRKHKETVHEKIFAPKNKVCDICGRGFRTNRTLIHHIRTHTGEKPHKCVFCTAAFAQKVALMHHIKTIHKNNK